MPKRDIQVAETGRSPTNCSSVTLVSSITATPDFAACLSNTSSNSARTYRCVNSGCLDTKQSYTHDVPRPVIGVQRYEIGVYKICLSGKDNCTRKRTHTPFSFVLIEFYRRTGLYLMSTIKLEFQILSHALMVNPYDLIVSSAPMNFKNGRTDGSRLSPMWYLFNIVKTSRSYQPGYEPWELRCLQEYNLESLPCKSCCCITTCGAPSYHENLNFSGLQ